MTENDSAHADTQASRTARRVARPVMTVADAVILADISDSMNDRDGAAGEKIPLRRIDRLAKVLDYLLVRVRVRSLICFNDVPVEVPLAGRVVLPEPAGSTALNVALAHVAGLVPLPVRCIVISDGMPNGAEDALAAARSLRPMIIDAYYVGPEGFAPGTKFMAELSAQGGPGGRSGHFDLFDPVLLGTELRNRLLSGPSR